MSVTCMGRVYNIYYIKVKSLCYTRHQLWLKRNPCSILRGTCILDSPKSDFVAHFMNFLKNTHFRYQWIFFRNFFWISCRIYDQPSMNQRFTQTIIIQVFNIHGKFEINACHTKKGLFLAFPQYIQVCSFWTACPIDLKFGTCIIGIQLSLK
jgi:hypothetical protein